MKEDLCNYSEDIVREIRNILIYAADTFTFNDNLKGKYPKADDYLLKIHLNEFTGYNRSIVPKIKNKNEYFSINISVPILDLSLKNREVLYKFNRKNKFVIVTESNMETSVFGNHREPLSIGVIDRVKDNGSGKDKFIIRITGKTTIQPKLRKITEPFRVLLFAPPLK